MGLRLRLAMAASTMVLLAVPAHANLIQNGTFDSSCGSSSFCTYYAGDSSDIYHWTVSGGSVDLITGYWQAPPGGGNSIDLDGNSPGGVESATQFATVSGDTYKVTFYLSGNPDGGPAEKQLQVSADGTSATYTYDTATEHNTRTDMKWVLETFTFVANSTLATLGFDSLDSGSPYGPAIGGVDVELAVPEPMTLSLIGSGLLAAGWFGRRRKNKS